MVVVCISQRAQVDRASIFLLVYTTVGVHGDRFPNFKCLYFIPLVKYEIKAVSKFRFRVFLVMLPGREIALAS